MFRGEQPVLGEPQAVPLRKVRAVGGEDVGWDQLSDSCHPGEGGTHSKESLGIEVGPAGRVGELSSLKQHWAVKNI